MKKLVSRLNIRNISIVVGLLIALAGAATYPKVIAKKETAILKQQGCCKDVAERRMIGTYYNTKEDWKSELILNNKGSAPIGVTPILYSPTGERFVGRVVSVAGQFVAEVDLNALANSAGPQFIEGSLEFMYTGRIYEVGGSIRIENEARGLIYDEQLRHPGKKFESQQYEAVFS